MASVLSIRVNLASWHVGVRGNAHTRSDKLA
jgi:hypothetical protein